MSAESGEKSKFLEGAKNFAKGVVVVALSLAILDVALFNVGHQMIASAV